MRHRTLALFHAAGATHSELSDLSAGFPEIGKEPSDDGLRILRSSRLRPDRVAKISDAFRAIDPVRFEAVLASRNVRIVSRFDPEYPEGFSRLPSAPFLLYLRWEFPDGGRSVSVVGSRKHSPYGRGVTESFVRGFAANGWSVVSGGAYGIDSVAHETALSSGGATIAIVGTGIDSDYPARHRTLFDRIAQTPGCGVLSCFPLGAEAMPYHFPVRNALVAAYSRWTLVTEAAENSGSLITARLALEFNREAFAVPGDIGRPTSAGTNALVRDGLAKCVTIPDDVLAEFEGSVDSGHVANSVRNDFGRQPALFPSDGPEDPILRFLQSRGGDHDVDAIAAELEMPVSETSSRLAKWEIG